MRRSCRSWSRVRSYWAPAVTTTRTRPTTGSGPGAPDAPPGRRPKRDTCGETEARSRSCSCRTVDGIGAQRRDRQEVLIEDNLGNSVEITSIDENTMFAGLADGRPRRLLSRSGRLASPPTSRRTSTTAPSSRSASSAPSAGSAGTCPATCRRSTPRLATWEGVQGPRAGQGVRERRDRRPRPLPRHRSVVLAGRRGDHRQPRAAAAGGVLGLGGGHRRRPRLGRSPPRSRSSCTGGCRRRPPAKYDLVEVELPEYTDECYADPAEIACAYPEDVLIKIGLGGLADKDPAVPTSSPVHDDQRGPARRCFRAVEIDGEAGRRRRRRVGRGPTRRLERVASGTAVPTAVRRTAEATVAATRRRQTGGASTAGTGVGRRRPASQAAAHPHDVSPG